MQVSGAPFLTLLAGLSLSCGEPAEAPESSGGHGQAAQPHDNLKGHEVWKQQDLGARTTGAVLTARRLTVETLSVTRVDFSLHLKFRR